MTLNTRARFWLGLVLLAIGVSSLGFAQNPNLVYKNGPDIDLLSNPNMPANEVAANSMLVLPDIGGVVPGQALGAQIQLRGPNTQINDPGLDNIQVFPGFRPFVEYTQSETTIVANGKTLVASYNSSANQPLVLLPTGLFFEHRFLSGFSSSQDGGKTWTSGFVPPVPGSPFTFGDGVVAMDRSGNVYYSSLGTDATGTGTVQVNKSTDGGQTWSDAVVASLDNGSDKEWIAAGPDPINQNRDNVYVTWTSFQSTGQQIRLAASKDGGVTWSSSIIWNPAPDPDPAHPQNSLSFTNPVVDRFTGTLYIPFAQFSNVDTDFLRILASNDGGQTFHLLNFNVPGSPIPDGLPVVQAGHLNDCGVNGGVRLSIHAGTPTAGRFGLPRWQEATRLVIQPSFAARNGVLYMAWNNSSSPFFGDPTSSSNILFVRSDDGGNTWSTPIQVNPWVANDIMHVLPSLTLDANNPQNVHVSYYTQHSDGTVDVDLANSHDRGNSFPANRTARLTSGSFVLPPTNVTLNATTTTNYDRTIRPCYALGEYQGVTANNGSVYSVWGDARNTVMQPVNALDPISGQTHTQEDVFFQKVKAQ
jgi:hypothetical protein